MAKKSKQNMTGLIINIVVIALAVLTICTLFMPIMKAVGLVADKEMMSIPAKGADVFSAAFKSEASLDYSDGVNMLIDMKEGDHAFVTVVMMWGYILTVLVSVATLVFAVLNILGMKFRLVNTVLGAALVVLAIVTFIFALITASKNSAITVTLDKETGTKVKAMITVYMMFAALIAGGAQVYQAKRK